jgi:hypothetical protein
MAKVTGVPEMVLDWESGSYQFCVVAGRIYSFPVHPDWEAMASDSVIETGRASLIRDTAWAHGVSFACCHFLRQGVNVDVLSYVLFGKYGMVVNEGAVSVATAVSSLSARLLAQARNASSNGIGANSIAGYAAYGKQFNG